MEGGESMRICRNDIRLIKPGEPLKPKRKTEPKKRKGLSYDEMTPAQRRKVDKIRRMAAEVNQDGRIFQGAEMRAY